MDNDPIFEQALDIMENGAKIPVKTTNRLLAAMLRQNHKVSKNALDKAGKNEKRIIRLEAMVGGGGALGLLAAILKVTGVI